MRDFLGEDYVNRLTIIDAEECRKTKQNVHEDHKKVKQIVPKSKCMKSAPYSNISLMNPHYN